MELDFQIFKQTLTQAVSDWPLHPSDEQLESLWVHFGAVVDCNRQFNLTRITDPKQAAAKHYADSLALLAWANTIGIELSTLLDIGTGAGFPAIPIAVMQQNMKVVAIESTAKKASFVDRTAKTIALKNLQVEHAHSSHWKSTTPFQIVTGRAVSSIAACIRNFEAFVQKNGYCVLYKTAELKDDETREGLEAARRAGLKACEPFLYELPQADNTKSNLDNSPEPHASACAEQQSVKPIESNKQSEPIRRQLIIFQR